MWRTDRNEWPFQVDTEQTDTITVVILSGRIDSDASQELLHHLTQLIESGNKEFVLDFSGVVSISSTVMRTLLASQKLLKQSGGRMILCSLANNVREVFDITGFSTIIEIFSTREAALAALRL
ncbi:MAG: STAS domain-containing protein [Spirochaetota bacterium]